LVKYLRKSLGFNHVTRETDRKDIFLKGRVQPKQHFRGVVSMLGTHVDDLRKLCTDRSLRLHVGVSVIPLGVCVQTNLDHLPHLVFNCWQVLFPFPPLDPVLQTRHVELNLLEGTAREMPLLRQVFEVVWLSLHAALQTYALRVKLKTALH